MTGDVPVHERLLVVPHFSSIIVYLSLDFCDDGINTFYRPAPHHTLPHLTAPYRTAPHRTYLAPLSETVYGLLVLPLVEARLPPQEQALAPPLPQDRRLPDASLLQSLHHHPSSVSFQRAAEGIHLLVGLL